MNVIVRTFLLGVVCTLMVSVCRCARSDVDEEQRQWIVVERGKMMSWMLRADKDARDEEDFKA